MTRRWLLALLLLYFATGCTSLYTPAPPTSPLHEEQGEVHVAGQHAADGSNQGAVSATPASHVIVYGSYLQSPSVSYFYEGGAGTYVRLNDPAASSPFLLEATVGYGRGSIRMTDVGAGTDPGDVFVALVYPFLLFEPGPAPYRITGTVERQSVQLTLGGIHHFEGSPASLEVGVGARTSRIAFSHLQSTGPSIVESGHLYTLDPNLTGRLDLGGFGFEAAGGLSIPLTTFDDQNADVHPLGNVNVGVGIFVDPVRVFTSQ